jgi:hypothetical protein
MSGATAPRKTTIVSGVAVLLGRFKTFMDQAVRKRKIATGSLYKRT